MESSFSRLILFSAAVGAVPFESQRSMTQEVTQQAVLKAHKEEVLCIAFAPDGKILASGSQDGAVKLWDVGTKRERSTLQGHRFPVIDIAFDKKGEILASGWDGTVKVWSVATGKVQALERPPNRICAQTISPDGKILAVGSGGPEDGKLVGHIQLWDLNTGKQRPMLEQQHSRVSALAFSKDGKTLASGSGTEIRLWEVITGKQRALLKGHNQDVRSLAFGPDGLTLASGDGDFEQTIPNGAVIKIWDLATLKERATLTGHFGAVHSVSFTSDGKRLASCDDFHTVKIWDVGPAKELVTLDVEKIIAVAFAPDGKTLACGCADGTIRLLGVDNLK